MVTATFPVHRCRFIDLNPSPITAIAFPPLPLPPLKVKQNDGSRKQPLKFGTLAVGHANGNIDLCEWSGMRPQRPAPQAWVLRKTLPGPKPSKVDSLAFAIRNPSSLTSEEVPSYSNLRLFSAGGGTELLEWDLRRACVRRTIGSQGGSIWSLAVNPSSTTLALGCEDGSVRLFSIAHDTLTHHRRFDRVKCRLLSIAWGPPVPRKVAEDATMKDVDREDSSDDEDQDEDWSDSWLVTGGSDSSIRKWDVNTGRVVERMGTDKIRGERTLVWAVGVLGDGTIVSGDSLGIVKFWDPHTCTQLQSFQGHGADVLCLTIGSEGTTVYTSGVDQKISQFSLISPSSQNQNSAIRPTGRWVHSCSRRLHSHDVRAIAAWPPYTPLPRTHRRHFPADIAPIIVSGGLDMAVVLTPAALPANTVVTGKIVNPLRTSVQVTFEESYQRKLAWSWGSAVKVAREARFVVAMSDTGVDIWRIKERRQPSWDEGVIAAGDEAALANGEGDDGGGWDKCLEIRLNVHTNLLASAVSDNGQWLVVSDLYETKLFALETTAQGNLNPRRVRDFTSILRSALPNSGSEPGTGGCAFAFTPDSSKLVMATCMSSYVLVVDLGNAERKPQVIRRFDHHRLRNRIGARVVRGLQHAAQDQHGAEDKGDDDGNEQEVEVEVYGEATSAEIANIHKIAVSVDGQWIATSDDLCQSHVFNLDSLQHHCILPSSPHPAHALAFDPTRPNLLLMGFPDNSILLYDVEARQFPPWLKHVCNSLPKRFTSSHEPILGVTFAPTRSGAEATRGQWALFWGSTWICKVPLEGEASGGRTTTSNKKRKFHPPTAVRPDSAKVETEQRTPNDGYKLITHYRPLLAVDFFANGEMVVVERPLVDVLAKMPPAYFRHKYGAT